MGQAGSTSKGGRVTEKLSLACSICNKPALVFESFVSSGLMHELAAAQVSDMCAFLAEATEPVKCQWCVNKARGEEAKEAKALVKETRRNEALIRKESLKGIRMENERQRSLLKKRQSVVVDEDDGLRRTASGRTVSFSPDVTIHRQPSIASIQPEPDHLSAIPQSYYQAAPATSTSPPIVRTQTPVVAPAAAPAPQPPERTASVATVPMISGPFAAAAAAAAPPAAAPLTRSISASPPIPVQSASTPPPPEWFASAPPSAALPADMTHDASYQIPSQPIPDEAMYNPPPAPGQAQSSTVNLPLDGAIQGYPEYNGPPPDTTPQGYHPSQYASPSFDAAPQGYPQYAVPADAPPQSYPPYDAPTNYAAPAAAAVAMPDHRNHIRPDPLEHLRRQEREAEERLANVRARSETQKREWAEQDRIAEETKKMQRSISKKREEAKRQEQEMQRRATLRQNAPPPRDTSNPAPPKKAKENKYPLPPSPLVG